MLRYRLISAIVLIPLILGAVLLGGPAYFALVFVAVMVSGFEFFQMARHAGHSPDLILGLGLIALLLAAAAMRPDWMRDVLAASIVLSLTVATFRRNDQWVVGWGITLGGALYLGLLGSYFLLMRMGLPDGQTWTGIILLATWATDTAAFVTGTAFGRHGFFTHVSPKKTWEGAIGGWAATTLAVLGLGTLAGMTPLVALGLGAGLGVAASFGDLAESLIKRQFKAKDSGAIVPGHGGLFDRVDSLLFAAVFGYYYLLWALAG